MVGQAGCKPALRAKTNGAFLAAQVVDELRVLVAPALDEAENVQGIVDYRNGLAGVVRLQLKSTEVLDHGVVQLAYAVLPPDGAQSPSKLS